MTTLPWFRFYIETIHDEKINVAANRTGCSYLEILGAWAVLLSLASKSPDRGTLFVAHDIPYEDLDMANACHVELETMRAILKEFIELNMLVDDGALIIKNWDRRQYIKTDEEKATHAQYVKEWRDEKKKSQCDNHITITNLSPSVSVSDSLINDSLTEKRIFSIRDAERAYIQVTGFPSAPMSVMPYLENILSMLQRYGWDETITRLAAAKDNWVSHKNKSNGANWKLTNPAWIDYAITGEMAGSPPALTREEREHKELQELIERDAKR